MTLLCLTVGFASGATAWSLYVRPQENQKWANQQANDR